MMTQNQLADRYLRVLRRRMAYLQERIGRGDQQRNNLSYDRAEIAALKWAVEQLDLKLRPDEIKVDKPADF